MTNVLFGVGVGLIIGSMADLSRLGIMLVSVMFLRALMKEADRAEAEESGDAGP